MNVVPDGYTGDIVKDLSDSLEKAIWLINDIQIQKVKVPYDTIARWENLIKGLKEVSYPL